ncbi:MAG: ABC-F family ATP-binding cassette domain-containing protein [Bryobacterales bacterium]|nr:ABC-F family ATP-binding cassette domain-containing protein [Bryobacterales bacterium]MBV9402026.1 ABC-F family ATP-binding cassette domain-containing protein [Bryobacterales bacterium]
MIQLQGAGKRFGHKLLFEDCDWLITPKERTGLVGANGTGKSTLLKILCGMESLDYGNITFPKGVRLGYLPQDGLTLSGRTVFAECMTVFAGLREMEQELEALHHKLPELDPASAEYAAVADRLHEIDSEFRNRDGYAIEAQVGTVLDGLGFRKEDWTRRTEEFSGGWQMRIALAKLLLEKPNLLLLDEPTNHLDLEARNWLETYLTNYPFGYVLISHDRYFLDITINRIVELWNKKANFYSGNYERYVTQKTERKTQLEAAYKNQRDRIEQLEAFINRFRYQATKAKQVQSRIKELEKIERIEIPPEEAAIHFSFPQPKPSGRIVAEFKEVSKSYGPKHVFSAANFVIERGDRIALVGINGAGKSTMIKLLAGTEPLTSGTYTLGHNVLPDYFAQDQYKELDPNGQLLYDLGGAAPRATLTELRTLLGCFLFSDEDVFKKIGVLSGGERNRYALARMLVAPSNFLLLDEPTNHLDMRAKDVLLEALRRYTGTVVFVSHDRYFIDNLATRVIEIEDGHVHIYPGNYEDYLWRKSGGPEALAKTQVEERAPEPAPQPEVNQSAAKRVNPMKLKKLQDQIKEVEQEVAELESEIARHEAALADFKSVDETLRLTSLVDQRRKDLNQTVAKWEQLSAELEATV